RCAAHLHLRSFPTRRSSDLTIIEVRDIFAQVPARRKFLKGARAESSAITDVVKRLAMANPEIHFVLEGSDRNGSNWPAVSGEGRSEEHTSELQSRENLVCRL